MTRTRFPFLTAPAWGTVSHYQVEGNDPCDWTDWEAAGKTRGEPCGATVDSWARYEEGALLASMAGANAFRFSVSWPCRAAARRVRRGGTAANSVTWRGYGARIGRNTELIEQAA